MTRPTVPGPVDWTVPPDAAPSLFGAGALPTEKALALATAVVGTGIVLAHAHTSSAGWAAWQYVIAAIIALDLLGGVVANGLNSAKRDHFGPRSGTSTGGRLVRRPVLFAAVHLQPVVVGAVFPGASLWWGTGWYLAILGSVVAVRRAPLYLQRPLALALCVAVVLASILVEAPAGFAWLPTVMVLKLPLAHAVQEEPYRPAAPR